MDDGEVISWGDNTHGQASVPASFNDKEIVTVYAGFYQNYAVTVDGDVETWGLKGYVCGTDDLGRDVFNRIINGGKVTMTVGAISVIIQLIIGIILGGLAGYFGGWVDNIIMRISEVVGGLPFLPFAMILSAIIGTRITVEQRMYLIMVVLGILSWPGICHLIRAQILRSASRSTLRRPRPRCAREVDHLPSHHPQCHEPDSGQRDAELCNLHAHRVVLVLYGLRHCASHADVGQYAHRREQLHRHPAVLVALGIPGCDLRHLHDLHQPRR